MRAEFINPFLSAAIITLQKEARTEATKGSITIETTPLVSEDVTVLIGVVGDVRGLVLISMSERTAKELVTVMSGEPVAIWSNMAESAIAELGNVVVGLASAQLEGAGYPCTISPPSVVVGRGTSISAVGITRLVIPLQTHYGTIVIHVALRLASVLGERHGLGPASP